MKAEQRRYIAEAFGKYLDNNGYKGKQRCEADHALMVGAAIALQAVEQRHMGLEACIIFSRSITEEWKDAQDDSAEAGGRADGDKQDAVPVVLTSGDSV